MRIILFIPADQDRKLILSGTISFENSSRNMSNLEKGSGKTDMKQSFQSFAELYVNLLKINTFD